jgi:hypothetical protein
MLLRGADLRVPASNELQVLSSWYQFVSALHPSTSDSRTYACIYGFLMSVGKSLERDRRRGQNHDAPGGHK